MSFLAIYAFFIAPVLLVVIAAGAAWLHLRRLKRHDRRHPAE
jgi:hypothetical protein